jgi:arylsulfatase A-like enzyme
MYNSNPSCPHLVFFVPDSFRGDVLGHAGNPAAHTPNLDHIVAHDGVSFVNAFAQNPVCTPSRCSFMTAWYTHVAGHRTMLNMLKPYEPCLLKTLKDHGYYVWWGGKNDLVSVKKPEDYLLWCSEKCRYPAPGEHSYDVPHYFHEEIGSGDPRYHSFYRGLVSPDGREEEDQLLVDDWWVDKAVERIKNPVSDQPLCIYLPLDLPHPPYRVEKKWRDLIDKYKLPPVVPPYAAPEEFPEIMAALLKGCDIENLDEEFWLETKAVYYAMCARTDAMFGKVVAALKEAGIYDDTAIFFISDHGDFAGDYGLPEKTHSTLQDCLLRVPFIVKPPKGMPVNPGVRKQLVELTDFVATVEDILHMKPSHPHFGKSTVPLFTAAEDPHREEVFAEAGKRYGEWQALNSETNKMSPDSIYGRQAKVLRQNEKILGFATMCRTTKIKYVKRLYEKDELYDLEKDPCETVNLINDPQYGEILIDMRERLLNHYASTCDVVPFEQDSRKI